MKKYITLTTLGLLIIVSISLFLRLYKLDQFPSGFNADEASLGYNAYSLLQTGKDEYGQPFPLAFKSFGDFKPGLYVYFTMPFISIFGLSETSTRIPSALFGVGTVILVFFLGKHLFKSPLSGLLSSLLLAINPWHIHFSRGAWETNVATFFISLGVLFFIKSLQSKIYLFWSLLSFLISMYIYQSPRLVVPVFTLCLLISYRYEILSQFSIVKEKIKIENFFSLVKYLIFLLILSIPLILQFISGGGEARFSGLSFFSDTGPLNRINELRGEHDNQNSLMAKFLHNKISSYGVSFLGHYLDHFSSQFLFINGDPLSRNKVPETGQFYLVTSIFLIVGLISVIKFKNPYFKLLALWIIVAPLASSMTYQTPHALRAHNLVIPLTLLMGYGFSIIVKAISNKGKYISVTILLIILSFETAHYLQSYFVLYPKREPLSWEYGFSEMVTKLQKYESDYQQIVITDRYDQPYILVLFYKNYDPQKYQPQAKLSARDKFNFGTIREFDNYQFRSITPDEVKSGKNTLFIGTKDEIPDDSEIIDEVLFPNGETAFKFAKT